MWVAYLDVLVFEDFEYESDFLGMAERTDYSLTK